MTNAGFVATTNAQGAGQWRKDYARYFKNRHVVILPDQDTDGLKHGENVAANVFPKAASVKVIHLTEVGHKGDVTDWFESEENTPERLMEIVKAGECWKPEAVATLPPEADIHFLDSKSDSILPDCPVASDKGRTELANSRRFLRLFGDRCLYCHPWKKWLIWNQVRWEIDRSGAIRQLAKEMIDQLWHEVADCPDEDSIKFARDSAKNSGITALLKLAESEVPIMPTDLDQNEWLLNCPNGTVDLRTGKLREHRKEDYITKLCPTNFNPESESYLWDQFLEQIFPDEGLADFVQRLFGYTLTGSTVEHVLPIFWGKGANGKSTVLEVLMSVIGSDYASKAPQTMLVASNGDRHPTELADLFGKRLVVCTETEESRKLNEALVKELTGGDKIRARKMREDFWEFLPTHKLILCTNHKPVVAGTDNGIWRRLLLIPFSQTFSPDQQDKKLKEKLLALSEGILAWAVLGCVDWVNGGLQIPQLIDSATNEYRSDEDVLGQFIDDKCLTGAIAYKIKAGQLFKAFEEWCEESGQQTSTQKKFGQRLAEMGFQKTRSNGWWYQSIALR
ncbi:DNA primase family protein [Polystyrenella longa]|uniref:DNA primase family protein n=1 Tax=Polystyrenella longa TaxID=2528007 RepID=UPI001E46C60E|nr:phage/plasmid primase, P4 family [Polystyrenella longa]